MADNDCPHCKSGGYSYSYFCLGCCARLVISAKPDRRTAQAFLESIERHRGRRGGSSVPTRDAILEKCRDILGTTS